MLGTEEPTPKQVQFELNSTLGNGLTFLRSVAWALFNMLKNRRLSNTVWTSSSRPSLRRLWPAVAVLLLLYAIYVFASTIPQVQGDPFERQIQSLHTWAVERHKQRLAQQSTTLVAARSEYEKRYGMKPPDGFDNWYQFAVSKDSPIIDDFDSLMADLRPFHAFHGMKCDQGAGRPGLDDLVRVCIENNQVVGSEVDLNTIKPLVKVMEELQQDLPNLCVDINILGLPRTVIPHAVLASLLGPNPPQVCELQRFTDLSKRNIWGDMTLSCTHDSVARNSHGMDLQTDTERGLILDWTASSDLCALKAPPPSGLIASPERLRLSTVARPIFSPAVFSSFNDIKIPSVNHFAAAAKPFSDTTEWQNKTSQLNWRGESAGGFATALNWHELHRQRIVALAHAKPSPPATKPATPLRRPGIAQRPMDMRVPVRTKESVLNSPGKSLRRMINLEFNRLVDCDGFACEAMRQEFRVGSETESTLDVFSGKLVLSMDGEGANTAAFYAALQSNSAPVRQSLLREWHDDRLVPWLHYVPLSLDLSEMEPLLAALFSNKGEQVAARIAQESKSWTARALRTEDMAVYVYRLLIEVGRRSYD